MSRLGSRGPGVVLTGHLPCQVAFLRITSADCSKLWAGDCLAPVRRAGYMRRCLNNARRGDIFCSPHGGDWDRLISPLLRDIIDEREALAAWQEEQSVSNFWRWWAKVTKDDAAMEAYYAEREASWSERERGVVYFLVRYDSIKIGTSMRLERRMESLQHPLTDLLGTVPGGPLVEREWHDRFRHLRTHGEWFRPADELLDAIAEAVG